MAKLYELACEYERLADLLDEDVDVSDALALVTDDLTTKLGNIARVLEQLDADEVVYAAESQRLARRAEQCSKRAAKLRAYVLSVLQVRGIEKVKCDLFTVAVRRNPPSVLVLDQSAVPPEYTRTTTSTTVDRKAVLADYKASGLCVPGTEVVCSSRLEVK